MSNRTTLDLIGKSGSSYTFYVYDLNTSFKKVGGVYAFTKRVAKTDGTGTHDILYVGKTDDQSTRFGNHHKASCINMNGANRLCLKVH